MRFRTRPCEIDAMQFTDESKERVFNWVSCNKAANFRDEDPYMTIQTLEGCMVADLGDWIIKGLKGEFYPCKPDIFAMKYELVSETPSGEAIT